MVKGPKCPPALPDGWCGDVWRQVEPLNKRHMEYYRLGSLFLDISICILVLGAVVRIILTTRYVRHNGRRAMPQDRRKALRKAVRPFAVAGLLFAVASLIMLFV